MPVDMNHYIEDGPERLRVHARAFSDPEIFDLEMRYIFECTWGFLALESQLPQPHDFVTTWIGRTPVLVSRDRDGQVGAYVNACRHKGAMVCTTDMGNRRNHVCPYHGWAYDSGGRNVSVKDRELGAYPVSFGDDGLGLAALARVESYRGLVFGSLSPDVPPLADYLAGARAYIDLIVDQGPQGIEFIPGKTVYTYDGNWKMQMDNGLDFYHLTSVHTSFLEVQARRRSGQGNQDVVQFDWRRRLAEPAGTFEFQHGHAATWLNQPEPENRPIYPNRDEISGRIGERRTDWLIGKLRNMTVFPNLQIADSTSPLLRTFRPLSPGRTEMRVFCIAPVGESRERRSWRLRQYEDFFNPSGLATPDDTTLYEDCQRSFTSGQVGWLEGYQRGQSARTEGPDQVASDAGIDAIACVAGSFGMQNEVCFHPPWREWARLLRSGLAATEAY